MKIFLALLLFFATLDTHAALIANSVSVGGASNVVKNSENNYEVYGSFLGASHGGDPTEVFDSCNGLVHDSTTFIGCNTRKVARQTQIRVSFNDNEQFTGLRQVLAFDRSNTTVAGGIPTSTPLRLVSNTNFAQNSNFFAIFTWTEVCIAMGGQIGTVSGIETCTDGTNFLNGTVNIVVGLANQNGNDVVSPVNLRFTIFTPNPSAGLFNPTATPLGSAAIQGIDGHTSSSPCPGTIVDINGASVGTGQPDTNVANYDYLCDFAISPGDRKLRLEGRHRVVNSLRFIDGNSSSAGINIPVKSVQFFTSNDSFADAMPGRGATQRIDFRIPGDLTSLEESIVETQNTQNGAAVFVRAASVDILGNVTHLTGDTIISARTECNAFGGAGANTGSADPNDLTALDAFYVGPDSCPYATVPGAVYGILDGDVNCFIATALRGTASDYQVMALRQFRNQFLNTNWVGKKFINIYYTHGPQMAAWIQDNPKLKPFMQVLLWPVYLLAQVFNLLGSFSAGLVFLLLFTAGISFSVRRLNSLFKH